MQKNRSCSKMEGQEFSFANNSTATESGIYLISAITRTKKRPPFFKGGRFNFIRSRLKHVGMISQKK
jgi:hypothetical protein